MFGGVRYSFKLPLGSPRSEKVLIKEMELS